MSVIVGVTVGVTVFVGVGVTVFVGVTVGVIVFVGVTVLVGVGVGKSCVLLVLQDSLYKNKATELSGTVTLTPIPVVNVLYDKLVAG